MSEGRNCSHCGSTNVWCDEVDVGVGIIYGPLHCDDCHFVEPSAFDEDFDADVEDFLGFIK